MKRKLVLLVSLVLIALIIVSTVGCGGGSSKKTFDWTFFIYMGPESTVSKIFNDFASEVKEKTGGKLNITVQSEGELPYKAVEALKITGNNSVQMADCSGGYIGGDSVFANIPYLPYLVTNKDEMLKTWDALKPYYTEDFKRFGAEPLIVYQWPGQYFWGKGADVKAFTDLKGKKIRTYSKDQQVYLQGLGATPVALTFAEVPEAVQRGVIDGMITSAMGIVDNKLYEILNWGYLANMGPGMNVIVINSKAMEELPKDVKKTLVDVANKYQDILNDRMIEDDKVKQKQAKDSGLKLFEPSPEDMKAAVDAAKSYYDQWANEKGGKVAEALKAVRAALGK